MRYVLIIAALILAVHCCSCANPLAQGRVAVLASKEMLRLECPQYLASLYPERLERCATRLVAQQAAEAAYNGAVLADAVGSGEFGDYYARFKGLIAGLLK